MRCEFDYCIYNRDFSCILEEPEINSFGMCDECIIVSIPGTNLKVMKEEQLRDIESRWKSDN